MEARRAGRREELREVPRDSLPPWRPAAPPVRKFCDFPRIPRVTPTLNCVIWVFTPHDSEIQTGFHQGHLSPASAGPLASCGLGDPLRCSSSRALSS